MQIRTHTYVCTHKHVYTHLETGKPPSVVRNRSLTDGDSSYCLLTFVSDTTVSRIEILNVQYTGTSVINYSHHVKSGRTSTFRHLSRRESSTLLRRILHRECGSFTNPIPSQKEGTNHRKKTNKKSLKSLTTQLSNLFSLETSIETKVFWYGDFWIHGATDLSDTSFCMGDHGQLSRLKSPQRCGTGRKTQRRESDPVPRPLII